MEVDTRQYLQDDLMNDHRSFGSTCHPSSQSRKISIGIMVDPLPERRSGVLKESKGATQNGWMENSNKENPGEGKRKDKGVANDTTEQVNSPFIGTSSFHQNKHTSRNDLEATKNSILDSGDKNQKKYAGYTYKRNDKKDQAFQREEDVARSQEAVVLDKVKLKATAEDRTENLRMKLFEILGTVSSPKSQPSHVCDIGVTDIMQEAPVVQKNDPVIKPIEKFENIGNPGHTRSRPVTRSLTEKRISTRKKPEKSRAPSSSYAHTFQAKNISFEDRFFSKGRTPANGSTSSSTRIKNQRKNFTFEPRKINFNENNKADEFKGTTHGSEASTPLAKSTSPGNNSGKFDGFPLWSKSKITETKNKDKERDSYHSPEEDLHLSQETSGTDKPDNIDVTEGQEKGKKTEMKSRDSARDSSLSPQRDSHLSQRKSGMHQPGNFSTLVVREKECHVENFGSPLPKNAVNLEEDFQSPTFKLNSPIISPCPSIMPNTNQIKQVLRGHKVAGRRFATKNISSFDDLNASKIDDYVQDAETESLDDEPELEDYHQFEASHSKGKKDSENELSKSSSSNEEYESSDEDSPLIKKTTAERSKFTIHQSTKFCGREAKRVNKLTPTPPSPQVTRENAWIPEPSEQNQGDELERIITLFALAVENFKNKMKLAARKKSSEILNSVSDDIRMQLQKIESKIQADLGKLTSTSKSKRKRLETGLEEQQEQLRLMHEKFKQDIDRHLQECKSTLEGLQMHQNEFKGALKKQKASHQKLLVQVEEAIQAQLNDADRRITDAHKLARRKMVQLKHVIAQCLNEDVLS